MALPKPNPRAFKTIRCQTQLRQVEVCRARDLDFIGEEPLLIRVEDRDYSVVMRTPGEEVAHAAGFCLGEGIVNSAGDFKNLGYDADLEPNAVHVWLTDQARERAAQVLERRGFVSQTSCGICGKEMIQDLSQQVAPAQKEFQLPIGTAFNCLGALSKNQKYYPRTRGSHASILFDRAGEILGFAEDVGRHNGLDKAIGRALLDGCLDRAGVLVLSSRISYELIQKAARADIPILISNSRPTALAVDMGRALNMTLAFPAGDNELIVVCGGHRILGS
ncbi:MAG: formate dehydrogenase accessory sulfurtransferase FdhD [Desulfobacterales bacterium]|nr:formate dehydrogenase accessory sulfurtransferase FdhD [Desulfobacterales bacterium]